MTAYAIAHLRPAPELHAEVLDYMERIQSTLDPFEGRFLIHGAPRTEVLEGDFDRAVVMIGFPSYDQAHAWYHSAAYQELLPRRTAHMDGDALLIDGVPPGYEAAATAAALRAARTAA
ncbi:DUF1330 domain-containing protein [Streptomyces solincola]|uniref:DUF1330 domain-containing protein n=1 Tax=Streptomyces solincola TaxID=2100817 RepID=A0A2S9PYY2_9ACTN|nr:MULTISPECIES: DUF1330 domain-containing protein [Streptomyces]PRH79624.1 DUF1330 domain-containing protein [Streptomyces solincola]